MADEPTSPHDEPPRGPWSGIKQRVLKRIMPKLIRMGWRPPGGVPLTAPFEDGIFGFDDEPALLAAANTVRDYSMSTLERMATLWHQVRYLDRCKIDGALVECGTWRGGSSGMMALAHLARGDAPSRRLHLFDSFEGLPEPDAAVDGDAATVYAAGRDEGKQSSIGECVGPLDDNKQLLEQVVGYPKDLLTYHVGWFQDTVPGAEVGPIALLRLDGDWYESVKVPLEGLYDRVVPGGVVVIDDYGHWEGCKRAVDEFIAAIDEPVLLSHIDYTGRYWIRTAPAAR